MNKTWIIKTYALGNGSKLNPFRPAIAEKYTTLKWTDVGHPNDASMRGVYTLKIKCSEDFYEKIKLDDTIIPSNLLDIQSKRIGKKRSTLEHEYETRRFIIPHQTDLEKSATVKIKEWKCQYCGGVNKIAREACCHCAAPRKTTIHELQKSNYTD